MTDTMIERMARAMEAEICRQTGEGKTSCFISDGCLALGDEHSHTEIRLSGLARAVLTAMREPTEAMDVAGLEWVVSFEETQGIFRDMIDAALEEGR